MKILLIHSDFIEVEPKQKAIKSAEDIEKKLHKFEECLVVFTSVEKADEGNLKAVVRKASAEIEDVLGKVKTKRVVLYPFVHLSSKPSSPSFALDVLKSLETGLKKKYEVWRAPFGWYKAFKVACKGHPLSELSREIVVSGEEGEEEVSKALKAAKKLKSKWFVITPEGKEKEVSLKEGKLTGFDFSKHPKLEKLALYEMAKSREVREEPPHVRLMRKLELTDYEPGSDPGNLRYPPKGRLMKSLLEDYVTREVIDYGAMEIEAPIMYDFDHPTLKKYLDRFPARQYTVQSPNKKCFLRFAACFGQFLMLHDATFSYKDLPLRMYELTRYSFRVEKRGELTGMRRLRAFTMPDCHAFCADIPQAKKEIKLRFKLAEKVLKDSGLSKKDDFEFAIRIVKDFYDENREFVHEVIKEMGKPVLVEMWDQRFFYFIFKYEWNFIDALDKASTLATDQIDVENGERYDLKFTDRDGKPRHPIILHLSPSGAIERVMYALLEKAYMEEKEGKVPSLPLWLSPTQVRICPVSESHLKFCEKLYNELIEAGIRADVDDRPMSIGKKIRDSGTEWIPYVLVAGDKEAKGKKLSVRVRGGSQKELTAKQLIDEIHKKTEGMLTKKLSLPAFLSKRPTFIG